MLQPVVALSEDQAEAISQRMRNTTFGMPMQRVDDSAGSQTSEDSRPLSVLARPKLKVQMALDNAAHEPAPEQYPRHPHGKNCN